MFRKTTSDVPCVFPSSRFEIKHIQSPFVNHNSKTGHLSLTKKKKLYSLFERTICQLKDDTANV